MLISTVRKRTLRRLCFNRCLSVQRGGVSRPRPKGAVGGVQAQAWGGCVSEHALRQTHPPPQQTATAADGTHPTGMHFCLYLHFLATVTHRKMVNRKLLNNLVNKNKPLFIFNMIPTIPTICACH